MAKRPRSRTFAELSKEPTWSETDAARTGRHAARRGTFNAAGEFFDLDGEQLQRVKSEVTPAEAQRLVLAGAAVVIEECGCGGWAGCRPEWIADDQLAQLRGGPKPRFTGRHDAPTWIDAWANDVRTVVFAHGDVEWGTPTA
jgi:hypothetical protein